jgi:hypothetical protein
VNKVTYWIDKEGTEHWEGVCEKHPHIKVTSFRTNNCCYGGKSCPICSATYLG